MDSGLKLPTDGPGRRGIPIERITNKTNPIGLSCDGSIRYMDFGQNKPKPSIFHAINRIRRSWGLFWKRIMRTPIKDWGTSRRCYEAGFLTSS